MDLETPKQEKQMEGFFEALEEGTAGDMGIKSKSSLRMTYEAQVKVIDRQLGGLEGARLKLGLSQRKMAQLLLVDPSAWTRWNRPGEEAPPHIWRALQWYMALQDKIPGLNHQYFIGTQPQGALESWVTELGQQNEKLKQAASDLQTQLAAVEISQRKTRYQLATTWVAFGIFVLFLLFKR